MHFAAESHVDRSILSAAPAFETNLRGTFTLLEAARANRIARFVHVSTDEVYGSLEAPAEADEEFPLNPSSPYSASKAGSDLLARSYFVTYRLPVRRHARVEQLRAVSVSREADPADDLERARRPAAADLRRRHAGPRLALRRRSLPRHSGRARQGPRRRDLQHRRQPLAAEPDVVRKILAATGDAGESDQDRRGPARARPPLRAFERQADARNRLAPAVDFEAGLARTVDWYRENAAWVSAVKSGEYLTYYARNYENRPQRGPERRLDGCAWPSTPRRSR